jgi:phytanoyl-CoA hydroxylase
VRSELSEQQVADYRTNGFLVVEELLTAPELARWRDPVDTVIAQDLVKPPADSAAGKAGVFDQRMNLRRVSAAMGPLVEDPAIGKLIAQLEGIEAVRVYLDQALVKQPYGAPTQFHQDLPWWPFDSAHAATIWIALDDATVQNGCLYFVPGSHHLDVTVGDPLQNDELNPVVYAGEGSAAVGSG